MEEERTETEGRANEVTEAQTITEGSKPLHRFLAGQPKYIGIALIFFGGNEMMLGLALIKEIVTTSASLYIPFWQAALFTICGSLSIHTHSYPSKKLVTVCLAMYIVTILGGFFSVFYRMFCITSSEEMLYDQLSYDHDHDYEHFHIPETAIVRYHQLVSTEALLSTSTISVIVLLICLCCFAKRSLRSSNTQIIMRQVLTVTDTE